MQRCGLLAICLITLGGCADKHFKPDIEIVHANTVLYESPGERGREFRALSLGEEMQHLGEVSDFFTPIALDGTLMEAPWIRVQTREGLKGWVYALHARPTDAAPGQWLMHQNLRALLGPDIANRQQRWHSALYGQTKESSLANLYHETRLLRADMERKLAGRPEPNGIDYQPNLNWLPALFPAMVFEWPADGGVPTPRIDYTFFIRHAFDRQDRAAIQYFSFCAALFPRDSIESAFPIWKMPLSEKESCSRLGAGVHTDCLKKIDSTLQQAPAFQQDLLQWKEALLEDIMGKNAFFWYAPDAILAELDQIRSTPAACLQERDLIALEERRKQFDKPGANRLRTDLRSGRIPTAEADPN